MSEQVGGPFTWIFVLSAVISGSDTQIAILCVLAYFFKKALGSIFKSVSVSGAKDEALRNEAKLKKTKKIIYVVVLGLAIGTFISGFWCTQQKNLSSSGLLLTIAGILQLEITDFFKGIFTEYSNLEKYPYGPPSSITREIIDNPDKPK